MFIFCYLFKCTRLLNILTAFTFDTTPSTTVISCLPMRLHFLWQSPLYWLYSLTITLLLTIIVDNYSIILSQPRSIRRSYLYLAHQLIEIRYKNTSFSRLSHFYCIFTTTKLFVKVMECYGTVLFVFLRRTPISKCSFNQYILYYVVFVERRTQRYYYFGPLLQYGTNLTILRTPPSLSSFKLLVFCFLFVYIIHSHDYMRTTRHFNDY